MKIKKINKVKLFALFINLPQFTFNVSIFVTPHFLFYPVSNKYLLYEDFLQILCVNAYIRTV